MNVHSDRFPLFDSLRAVAALMVVGSHAVFYANAQPASFVAHLGPRLEVGVAIFFVISGFLLYRPFVKARLDEEKPLDVRAYAWRRFLRIAPGYWVILTIATAWIGFSQVFTPAGIPIYYGFAQIYSPDYVLGGLSQAWTLCVEVSFYALLPAYALVMRRLPATDRRGRLRNEAAGLVVLVVVALAWQLWRLGSAPDPDQANAVQGLLYLPGYLDHFAVGMAIAVTSAAIVGKPLPSLLRPLHRLPGLGWAGAAIAFLIVSFGIGLTGRGGLGEYMNTAEALGRHYLYALVGLGIVLPAVFGDQERGLLRRVLANRGLLYLGTVSYGVYLWHVSVYLQLQEWGFLDGRLGVEAILAWFAVCVPVTVALASLTYWLVERPALSLKRLVSRRRPAARESEALPPTAAAP